MTNKKSGFAPERTKPHFFIIKHQMLQPVKTIFSIKMQFQDWPQVS